jgi:hypothetical protein
MRSHSRMQADGTRRCAIQPRAVMSLPPFVVNGAEAYVFPVERHHLPITDAAVASAGTVAWSAFFWPASNPPRVEWV